MKKGFKMTLESRRKMSEAAKKDGRKPPSRKGIKHTEEWKKNMSKKLKGRVFSEETIKKRIASVRRGSDCHFWRGGITSLKILIRQNFKYRQWRLGIFERDDFVCQECGARGGRLNADHIKSFSLILNENNIKKLEDALKCKELWDLDNGRTLCEECHKKTDNYGRKEQFRNQKYTKGWQEAEEVPGWEKTKDMLKFLLG